MAKVRRRDTCSSIVGMVHPLIMISGWRALY